MDLSLALAHMKEPSEGVPHGADHFDWAYAANVVMGCNATASGLPSWYAGVKHAEWPRICPWFTIYRESGSRIPKNTRVEVRNLKLWRRSIVTGLWNEVSSVLVGGRDFNEEMSGASQAWNIATTDDGWSLRPPVGFCAHGWGVIQTIDINDISGVMASIEHRIVVDDPSRIDSRCLDKWVVNVGVDYSPAEGVIPGNPVACFATRYVRSRPDWNKLSGAVLR